MAHLNMSDIPNLPIFLPPISRQGEIVDGLDRFSAGVNRLTETLSRQVEILHEYRLALITAAVAGELNLGSYDLAEHLPQGTA